MKNIGVFDTSVRTLNLGDYIIMESVYSELEEIFNDSFLINLSTHSFNDFRTIVSTSKLVENYFVGGTNLLSSDMYKRRYWKIRLMDSFL